MTRRRLGALGLVAIVGFVAIVGVATSLGPVALNAGSSDLTIFAGVGESLDPAAAEDDIASEMVMQVFETLTSIDASQHVQPALAQSWQTLDGGKRIVFQLRPNLAFSNGAPLRAADVVRSWLRVLQPDKNSLASLLDVVVGATAYRTGQGPAAGVGIHAIGDSQVEVQLTAPAADFAAIASAPTFAVVPANADAAGFGAGSSFVGSGGYVAAAETDTELTLKANPHYWAGKPAIDTIHVRTDLGGKSPVSEFQAGNLDYTPVSDYDASWIAYDRNLGPSLREIPPTAVEYYAFDTSRPPFSDVHVRRAFRLGIDWRSLVSLGPPTAIPATSMVPPGIPGRSATDFGPAFDLTAARAELAAAGYPDGKGFPTVTLVTWGATYDDGVVRQLHDNLGIDVKYETRDWTSYFAALASATPPAFWAMGWTADYPGADDFLGMLLGTNKPNNYGRWSSAAFDAAIAEALGGSDAAAMQQAFDKAQAIVRDEVPAIPLDYGSTYAIARNGLLGAIPNGQGFIRYAGLAWGQR